MTAETPKTRWIAHVDLDAFFASVEQRDNPEYRGRPVVVGARPGGRGVVAASSYEAREFGIRSAMPISEAYRRCPDAVYVRPDMATYARVSREIFTALESITPVIEKASVDEAYLDISGLEKLVGSPEEIGERIRRTIYEATQLTASVGIGPNRLIAKLASDYDKPDGLTVVPPNEVQAFLDPMPVENLRGAGRKTQELFRQIGVRTIGDFRRAPFSKLEEHLGLRSAESFLRQARGEGSTEVVPGRERKSISKEETFSTDVTDHGLLRDELRTLAAGVARIARRENKAGTVVRLKVRYTGFETHTRQKKLPSPTQDERVLLNTAWELFTAGSLPDKPVRLIGVGISDWEAPGQQQGDLFAEPVAEEKDDEILKTLDEITERFGAGKLTIGIGKKD